MSLTQDVKLLGNVPLLADFPDETLRLLAFSAESRSFGDGEALLTAGQTSEGAYLLTSGQVRVIPANLQEGKGDLLRQGSLLGEMNLITDAKQMVTATAVGETAVLFIRRSLFLRMLDEYPHMARLVQARLAAKLRRTTAALAKVKQRLDALE